MIATFQARVMVQVAETASGTVKLVVEAGVTGATVATVPTLAPYRLLRDWVIASVPWKHHLRSL